MLVLPAVAAAAVRHPPEATPASTPDGLASSCAANTPTAVMMMAPGYWNSAPDSRPPAQEQEQEDAKKAVC